MENTDDNSGINKKFLLIGGIGIFILIFIIIVLTLASKKKNTSSVTPSSANMPVERSTFSGTEGSNKIRSEFQKNISKNDLNTIEKSIPVTASTARIILDWLDSQHSSDGRYNFGLLCNDKNVCDTPLIDNRSALAALWGRFKYYSSTQDPKDLEIMKKDIATLNNPSITEVIQNDFWNCKLTYEMYQSDIFNTTEKDQIKQICLRSSNYPLDEMDTENPQNIPTSNESNIDNVIKGATISYDPNKTKGDFSVYATSASDKAIKYVWNRNQLDLKVAQLYFDKSLALYSNNKAILGDEGTLLGVAALDLFKATKNNKYLSLAYYIYKNHSLKLCGTENGCIGMLFLSSEIYDLVKELPYSNFNMQTKGYLIDNKFDKKPYNGFVNGKGAIYFNNNGRITYSVRANGLIVGNLMQ